MRHSRTVYERNARHSGETPNASAALSLVLLIPNHIHTSLLRGLAITFSTISLALFATTLSVYNDHIAPVDGRAPLNDTLLAINAVPIVPLTLSIIWCSTLLLALCFRTPARQNAADCSIGGTAMPESQLKRPLVSLKLEGAIDSVLWVVMVVTLGFTAAEVANWRGDMEGFVGVGKVRLSGCPSVSSTTGTLEWYCTAAWKRLSGLQIAACCHLGLAR
jgi:hypothetical protein